MSLILVGEVNPYGADPFFALYQLPRHASGNRLREHLGLSDEDYEGLARINLCAGRWSLPAGRETAARLLELYDVLVLLGSKVRAAFAGPPPFEMRTTEAGKVLVGLPHPSGLNRLWDAPDARSKARRLLATVAAEIPWGAP